MVNLQESNIPNPLQPIEIDAFLVDMLYKFKTNLGWLSHGYSRAYRHFQNDNGKNNFYPEVYAGTVKGVPTYVQPTPDNDKKGICYFVVGKEKPNPFNAFNFNYISQEIGIVFWVNLSLINEGSLDTELITQQLIAEVRDVLTRKIIGTSYRPKIIEVCREFTEVFKEYNLAETKNYLKAPYQAFRFNCIIDYQEDCITAPNRCQAINQNISVEETLCLLPKLDFSDDIVFNTLTDQQKQDLTLQLGL